MDEAGNFVESTAHIESTNGKPTGGIQTIDKYTWDLDSKTLTIEDVRSHFKGIPTTFDMTADAFKNNVYESLLDTKKVPNAAAMIERVLMVGLFSLTPLLPIPLM